MVRTKMLRMWHHPPLEEKYVGETKWRDELYHNHCLAETSGQKIQEVRSSKFTV